MIANSISQLGAPLCFSHPLAQAGISSRPRRQTVGSDGTRPGATERRRPRGATRDRKSGDDEEEDFEDEGSEKEAENKGKTLHRRIRHSFLEERMKLSSKEVTVKGSRVLIGVLSASSLMLVASGCSTFVLDEKPV